MNSLKVLSIGVIGATVVGFGVGSAPAEAATVFNNEAAFLSNVQLGSYLETFDSLPVNQIIASPRPFSENGFSYTASAASDFFNAGSATDVWLSTLNALDPIVFNFTSGNISAVGGAFFPSNTFGNIIPGSLILTLSDSTTQTLTNTNENSFIGFIANPGSFFTSLSVTSVNPPAGTFPTVNDFRVGTATTATPIPTPALLPGLVGLGLSVWRKRKTEAAEANSEV